MLSGKWREFADKKIRQRDAAAKALEEETRQKAELEKQLKSEQGARSVLQAVAQAVQQTANDHIARIVTKCLQTVYDSKYEFQIVFDQKRGKTEARFVYLYDGHEVDPVDSAEGGALDITSLAMRIAALLLAQPQPRKLLVLDESCRFVDRVLAPKVRDLILALAKEMEIQFLLVTHDPLLAVGKVHDFS